VNVEPAWLGYLLVALGAGLGSVLRYLAGHLADPRERVPAGTVAVNLAGSLLLGLLVGSDADSPWLLALLGLGFCGALTTYSSFMVQAHDRGPRTGSLTILLTAVPAIALYVTGHWVGGLIS
jgi:fluoride exporter